jgi:hypothetical protein
MRLIGADLTDINSNIVTAIMDFVTFESFKITVDNVMLPVSRVTKPVNEEVYEATRFSI